jgi:hypothetical protein
MPPRGNAHTRARRCCLARVDSTQPSERRRPADPRTADKRPTPRRLKAGLARNFHRRLLFRQADRVMATDFDPRRSSQRLTAHRIRHLQQPGEGITNFGVSSDARPAHLGAVASIKSARMDRSQQQVWGDAFRRARMAAHGASYTGRPTRGADDRTASQGQLWSTISAVPLSPRGSRSKATTSSIVAGRQTDRVSVETGETSHLLVIQAMAALYGLSLC